MGSNPTPRVSNRGSTKRNKNKQQDHAHAPRITNKKDMTLFYKMLVLQLKKIQDSYPSDCRETRNRLSHRRNNI
ncbi:MAG TPA: hypothetical protein VJ583_06295 [Nitrososphaeraceae archaeon]|nr:hypothetical protein [Nitrososphaeraceae archaeon]